MNRVRILDPLRGLAALSVTWFHLTHGFGGTIRQSGSWGWVGVAVFFAVSGFVIPYSMARGGYRLADAGTFLAKRFRRLYPPYLAAVLLAAGLWYASALAPGFRGEAPSVSALDWLAHLTLSCGLAGRPWLSPVFWTLAIEAQFYALCVFVAVPLSEGRAWVPAALALLGLIPARTIVFAYLPLFALGMTAYQTHTGIISRRAALASAAIAFAVGWFGPMPEGRESVVAAAATAGLIVLAPGVTFRPLAWLGSISYSLYLVHVVVGGRAVNLGLRLPPTAQPAVLAAAIGLSVLAAWLLWRLVETPSEAWSGRLRYGPKVKPIAAAGPPPTPAREPLSAVATDGA